MLRRTGQYIFFTNFDMFQSFVNTEYLSSNLYCLKIEGVFRECMVIQDKLRHVITDIWIAIDIHLL